VNREQEKTEDRMAGQEQQQKDLQDRVEVLVGTQGGRTLEDILVPCPHMKVEGNIIEGLNPHIVDLVPLRCSLVLCPACWAAVRAAVRDYEVDRAAAVVARWTGKAGGLL
jgi:hypothetical protein